MTTATLTNLLNNSLAKNLTNTAVKGSSFCWTYSDLDKSSKTLAYHLQNQGVSKGDRIILLTGNSSWSVSAFLAIIRMGAVEVALHPSDAFVRILTIIKEVKPKLIIVGDYELKERLESKQVTTPILIVPYDKSAPFTNELANTAEAIISPNDIALIQYTSGSTGNPRGVVLSQGAIGTVLSHADYVTRLYRKRLLLGIPLAHAYGKTCLIEYLFAGAEIFLEKGFLLPRQVTELILKNEIQAIEGPPTLYEMACKDTSFNTIELPNLSYIAMNSAKPRKELLLQIRKRFPQAEIVVRYGISEIAGPISRLIWYRDKDVPLDSCGTPEKYVDIEILDKDGHRVSQNKPGEVVVRSPGCMDGYVDDVANTGSTQKQDYKTGDVGHFDLEGYLYLLGRKNFMIKSAGHRIFPKEIEDVIGIVPGIVECSVGSIPDDRLGEKICAWIVPEAGTNEEMLRQQIVNACRNRLQFFRRPHLIIFKKTLPKTVSDKVKRTQLMNEFLSEEKVQTLVMAEKVFYKNQISKKQNISTLQLYDNTMRDGEQTVGVSFSAEDKIRIAMQLVKVGILNFEAGFAAVSEEERESIIAVIEKNITENVFSLARLIKRDVDYAINSGVRHITLFVPSSDSMIQARLQCSEQEVQKRISQVVDYAKKAHLFVKFSCEDATRTPLDRLVKFYSIARDSGADYMSLPDTCGIGTPERIAGLVTTLKQEVKLPISFHGHNDLGLAVANSIAAAKAGADEIQVTVNGLGERTGNTTMDEFILAMKICYGVDLGIDLIEIVELSRLLIEVSGMEPGFNKPVIGRNAFRHESGIHVQALLKEDLETYEPFPPEWVGRKHEVAFGKHSGRSNIRFLCREVGLSLNLTEEAEVLKRIKSHAQEHKQDLKRGEILEIILETRKAKLSV